MVGQSVRSGKWGIAAMVLKRLLASLSGGKKPEGGTDASVRKAGEENHGEPLVETPVTTVRGPAVLQFGLMSNTSNARQEFAGDTEGLDEFYEMQSRANSYLLGFNWHRRPLDAWVGLYIPGIVGVFLFRIEPISEDIDGWMWVVVGDLPSAVIMIDDCPHGPAALANYVDAMREWVDAVRKGEPVDDLIPVNTPPTAEYADMLESRLGFLSEEVLSEYAPYQKK
jgi:hypothetical protein